MQWNSKSQKVQSFNINELGSLITLRGAFIYILVNKEEVIYVGQTKAVFNRVSTHLQDKVFDKVHIKPIKGDNHFLEAFLIFQLKPKLNYSIPSNERFICINHLAINDRSLNGESFDVHIIGRTPYFDSRKYNFLRFDKKRDRVPQTQEERIRSLEMHLAHEQYCRDQYKR